MQIQINTDHNIEGHQALTAQISEVVENALSRFSDHITRVDVHLSDENSDKKGGNDDIHYMMEARLEGRQPIAALIRLSLASSNLQNNRTFGRAGRASRHPACICAA